MSNTNNLLTLFTWMGLLSSTGSTAAALTLNTTPMRAANTTRSCMLWQECRWPTRATVTGAGGSQRQCGCVWLCVCVWAGESEQLRLAGDPEKNGGEEKSGVQLVAAAQKIWCFFSSTSKAPHSFIRLYPLRVCHWRRGWWVYDRGWRVCARVWMSLGVCRRAWKRRRDEEVRTQQMEPFKS